MRLHDQAALVAARNMSVFQQQASRSAARLASGQRILSAADDAGGLVRSEQLRSQIRGNEQALLNIADARSYVAVTEQALDDVTQLLQDVRELVVASGGASDPQVMQDQIEVLFAELEAMAGRSFSGRSVLADFSEDARVFQVGAGSGDQVRLELNLAVSADEGGFEDTMLAGLHELDVTDMDVEDALEAVDGALGEVLTARTKIGAMSNRFDRQVTNLQVQTEHLMDADSRLRDVDVPRELAALSRAEMQQQVAATLFSQTSYQTGLVFSRLL